jgi:hypothetical protein
MTTDQDQFFSDKHLGQGQCKDCGGLFRIVGSGAVKRHDVGLLGLAGNCPGSGQQPVKPVPCITCGRIGLGRSMAGRCSTCARKARPVWRNCPACYRGVDVASGVVPDHDDRAGVPCPGSGQQVSLP